LAANQHRPARTPPDPTSANVLASLYLDCKTEIVRRGFAWEIDWQFDAAKVPSAECELLAEGAWTILSAGMKEKVITRIFPDISALFLNWESAQKIVVNASACKSAALNRFACVWKIEAIIKYAHSISSYGWKNFLEIVRGKGPQFLREGVGLGPITSIHLAKNLGCDLVKPDRHLVRIAKVLGCSDPIELCSLIASQTGEKLSVIDVVLWRYAVLYQDYETKLTSSKANLGKKFDTLRSPELSTAH